MTTQTKITSKDMVQSKSEYRKKDHKNFYLFHWFFKSGSTYFFLLAIAFLIWWSIRTTNSVNADTNLNAIIMVWTMTGATILAIPLLTIFRIKDALKKDTVDIVESFDTTEVSKTKIVRSNSKRPGKLVLSWYQIESIVETKKYIYINTGSKQGIFIVKSDIEIGSVETFRYLAKYNMRKNKRGKLSYSFFFFHKRGLLKNV